MADSDLYMDKAEEYRVGSKAYNLYIENLFKEKEKCGNENNLKDLIERLARTIRELKENILFLPMTFVLGAHQVDNWYCASGHAQTSVKNGENTSNNLEKAQEEGEKLVESYEEHSGEQIPGMDLAGVWVYGYSAMAHLTSKKFGDAERMLEKADKCLEQIYKNAARQVDRAKENNALLEAGFLNNCWGRYFRDYHNSTCYNQSLTTGAEEAFSRFELSRMMYEELHSWLGEEHFLHEIELMMINCVRTLLGNLSGKESWMELMDPNFLKMSQAKLRDAKRLNRRRHAGFNFKDRLDFRITFYGAHLSVKKALWHEQKNNYKKYLDDLKKAKRAVEQCKGSFGSCNYAELRDIDELLKFIDDRLLSDSGTVETQADSAMRELGSESCSADHLTDTSGSTSSSSAQKRPRKKSDQSKTQPWPYKDHLRKKEKRVRIRSHCEQDKQEENFSVQCTATPFDAQQGGENTLTSVENQGTPGTMGFYVTKRTKGVGDGKLTTDATDS